MSDPTTPTPPPPAEATPETATDPAPAAQPPRPRPSWVQVAVAAGALVAVLAIAGLGFALGRVTGGHDDRPGRPDQEQRFDRGPDGFGGPGMMPPGLPPNGTGQGQQPDTDDEDDS